MKWLLCYIGLHDWGVGPLYHDGSHVHVCSRCPAEKYHKRMYARRHRPLWGTALTRDDRIA